MRYLYLVLKIAIFMVFLIFAVSNTQPTVLKIPLGPTWQQPLILVLLLFFAAGIAAGMGATFLHVLTLRRELAALKRELRERQQLATMPPDATIGDTLG